MQISSFCLFLLGAVRVQKETLSTRCRTAADPASGEIPADKIVPLAETSPNLVERPEIPRLPPVSCTRVRQLALALDNLLVEHRLSLVAPVAQTGGRFRDYYITSLSQSNVHALRTTRVVNLSLPCACARLRGTPWQCLPSPLKFHQANGYEAACSAYLGIS